MFGTLAVLGYFPYTQVIHVLHNNDYATSFMPIHIQLSHAFTSTAGVRVRPFRPQPFVLQTLIDMLICL